MTGHTPEPWLTHAINVRVYIGPGQECPRNLSRAITSIDLENLTPEAIGRALADAERIVACVNACAGIPTEQLGSVKALVEAVACFAGSAGTSVDPDDAWKEVLAALTPFRKD